MILFYYSSKCKKKREEQLHAYHFIVNQYIAYRITSSKTIYNEPWYSGVSVVPSVAVGCIPCWHESFNAS